MPYWIEDQHRLHGVSTDDAAQVRHRLITTLGLLIKAAPDDQRGGLIEILWRDLAADGYQFFDLDQ